jgi:ABC-type iron transport system FetAB ATPase subunit
MANASFNNETLHVVDYFNGALQVKNENVINDVFTKYVLNQSKIDINANHQTADKIRTLDREINREGKEVNQSHF